MEFLLVNHPLDCPICDQGGECDLQASIQSLHVCWTIGTNQVKLHRKTALFQHFLLCVTKYWYPYLATFNVY